jgi:hypothetical protein
MKFHSREMTNLLLFWILAFLLYHFEPDKVWNVAMSIVGMWLAIKALQLPAKFKADRAKAKQEEADETEYCEYKAKWNALREKYDPKGEWNEITNIPQAYLDEVRELNLQYKWIHFRRNGHPVNER